MRSLRSVLAIVAIFLSSAALADPIERIHPADGIASVHINAELNGTETHVTFVDDMIPLGGGDNRFPVRLVGPGHCNWGWRGPRTVSCLLGPEDRLPAARHYELRVEGMHTVAGKEIPPFRMPFETPRPVVSYAGIDWQGPVSPIVYVYTNVPVTVRELERRVRVAVPGQTGGSVAVRASADPNPEPFLPADQQFAIEPLAPLAPDTPYVVRVADGLAGVSAGRPGTVHDAGAFRTHAAFRFLGVGCGPYADRSYADSGRWIEGPAQPDCAPEQPVALIFSAEPEIRGLYDVLTAAGVSPGVARTLEIRRLTQEQRHTQYYQAWKVAYAVTLYGFAAGRSHSVDLRDGIRDRFGRALEPATASFPMRNRIPAFLVSYYAQAAFAGEFTALPARVESMYSTGVFATTAPAKIRVRSGD